MSAPPPLRTLIIINYQAARAARTWPRIAARLRRHHLSFETYQTTHAGDAETAARAALREGYQLIAVVGGDGTLSEAASGFFEAPSDAADDLPRRVNTHAALALLPSGTGDDFARGLLNRRAAPDEWADKLINYARREPRAAARCVDVLFGSVNGGANKFICLNAATLGIGAEVAGSVAAQGSVARRLPGEARFAAAALGALARWRERRVRVTIDEGDPLETSSNLIAVANGLYAGGGMMFTPAARSDDGRLDVLVAHRASRRMILRELTRIHSGGHVVNPKVLLMSGARVRIETAAGEELALEADGNVRGTTPAEFVVMPRRLRIVV